MESNPLALASTSKSPTTRGLRPPTRLAIGIGVLGALYYFGYLDLKALGPLAHAPWTIAASAGLLLVTLPIAAWRWAIVLRALAVTVPLVPLLRIIFISTFVSQVSFGPGGADAVRGIYLWRLLRRAGGRIAVSVLVDRASGLCSLIALTASTMLLRWERVSEVAELRLLSLSLLVCLAGALLAGAVLLMAPSLLPLNWPRLQQHQRIKHRLGQIHDLLLAFRKSPGALAGSVCLSLVIHALTIISFLFIADSLQIGNVTLLDVAVAAPLAMVANILPFTPGGLGVGEAAFDQICRWLATSAMSAPYASIFFAFRAVSMVMLVPGAIALIMHRYGAWPNDARPLFQEEFVRRGTHIEQ
jgi:uncharacterized protein (TIRG00374 family)